MPKEVSTIAQRKRRVKKVYTTSRQWQKHKSHKTERADHKFIRVLLKSDSCTRRQEHEKQIFVKVMERHSAHRQNFILCTYCWYFFAAPMKDISIYGKHAFNIKQLLKGYCYGGLNCFSDWCEKIVMERFKSTATVVLPGYLTRSKRLDWDCPSCGTKKH